MNLFSFLFLFKSACWLQLNLLIRGLKKLKNYVIVKMKLCCFFILFRIIFLLTGTEFSELNSCFESLDGILKILADGTETLVKFVCESIFGIKWKRKKCF